MQKRRSEVEDFYVLVRELVVILTTKDLEVWATVSLSIWNARNRYLFDKKQSQPSDILQGALSLLQEYQRLCQ